ncbi:MAG: phage minor capsid protein [Ruminococcus sp.]|nr:phage minor capsid protein [Ruminococcus sp.]
MLAPNCYEVYADEAVSLYRELENDIISDIIRRIIKTGKITATAEYQLEILQNSELLYNDILDEISKKSGANEKKIREIFENSGRKTVESDNEIYRENGLKTVEISQSEAMKKVLESRAKKTFGNMKNLTLTTADTSQTAYINACNSAHMQVVSGAFSYQEAIKNAVKKTAENGVAVRYPSGKTDRFDIAVRRAVLTGVGQTAREISVINAEEAGCDLMEISAHSGARPSHAKWQGKIVSLSGKKGYLSKRDIGYGSGDGFGGWNCRHDWFPFFEGRSKRNYTEKDLEKLDEKNIEYNGKKYSQYEISQAQRKIEREIRSAKREQLAFKTAYDETKDPETKKAMLDSLNDAKRKVAEKQAKMRDFVRQTGQDRDYFREQNYSDKPTKNNFGKDLTFSLNSGKININKSDNIDFPIKPLSENAKEFQNTYMEQYSKKYPKYIEALTYRFNNGSERMQNLFLDYVRLDSVADESLVGKTPHFNPTTKKIYMNFTLDFIQNSNGKGVGMVYFHEHGHLIDKALGDISFKNEKFYNALEKDYVYLKKQFTDENITYEEMCIIISEQFQNPRTDCGVSDIVNGLSYGAIKGCGYHDGTNYWNKKTICQEAFANIFDSQFDEQKYKRMQSFFPNALQEFERMLEESYE